MVHFDRYYTIEEANNLLPELRDILAEVRTLRDQLVEDWQRAEPVLRAAPFNRGGHEAADYVADLACLNEHLTRSAQRSLLLTDIDRGLVDFPALRNGEEVLLCWELSEDRVAY